jgi:hypothetical protein
MFIAEMKHLEEIYPGISQIYLSVLTKDLKIAPCHLSDISKNVFLSTTVLKEYVDVLVKRKDLYFVDYDDRISYSTGYFINPYIDTLSRTFEMNLNQKVQVFILLRDFCFMHQGNFDAQARHFLNAQKYFKESLNLKKEDCISILKKVLCSAVNDLSVISTLDINLLLKNNLSNLGEKTVETPVEQQIVKNIIKIITYNKMYKIGNSYNKEMVRDLFKNLVHDRNIKLSFEELETLLKHNKPSIVLIGEKNG